MKLKLKIWRQQNVDTKGGFTKYEIDDITPDMSFLEMLDVLNQRLINEIETLFEENLEKLLQNQWTSIPQSGSGTFHKQIDLPKKFAGWNSKIKEEIEVYAQQKAAQAPEKENVLAPWRVPRAARCRSGVFHLRGRTPSGKGIVQPI